MHLDKLRVKHKQDLDDLKKSLEAHHQVETNEILRIALMEPSSVVDRGTIHR